MKNEFNLQNLEKSIEEKGLQIDPTLLHKHIESIVNGRFNLLIDSEPYKIFKQLLTNGLLPTEKFNDPEPINLENYTLFERFLIYNFKGHSYGIEQLDKVKEILIEAQDLTKLGVEKKCLVFDLAHTNAFFEIPRDKIDPNNLNQYLPLDSNERKKVDEIEKAWNELLNDGIYPEKTGDRSIFQVTKFKR